MKSFLISYLAPIVRPKGKEAFLKRLAERSTILDVGCGNDSPKLAKLLAPSIIYTGLDVSDYNQSADSLNIADKYISVPSDQFASTVEAMAGSFDAVISSHNLEHCEDPNRVLLALCGALKPGGQLYLSFPSEASVNFPRRKGNTLNFFDDPTHQHLPKFEVVIETLRMSGVAITSQARRHRPLSLLLLGLLLEPLSWIIGRAMPAGTTWALYGFESVIWGQKPRTPAVRT